MQVELERSGDVGVMLGGYDMLNQTSTLFFC
jgi:hypothetical protein